MEFKVDNSLKQEYLESKPTKTATSDAFVLRSADDFEDIIDKKIYDMSYSELNQMLAMQFKNSSRQSNSKNISILKNYIDFCIDKNIVLHGENRLATFTSEKAKEFVSKSAMTNKYISKEKLREYQNILYNEQDKLLLELLFVGVRGRTTIDGTLEEVINLKIDDVDVENNMLKLTHNNGDIRFLEVETSTVKLIQETFEQGFYVENNGEITNNPRVPNPRKTIVNEFDNLVFRIPGKNKYNKFNPNLLNSRMKKIQKILDNMYITYTSLYMSGMIDMAMNMLKEKECLKKEDYIFICNRYAYGSEPEKYWFQIKALIEEYLELTQ